MKILFICKHNRFRSKVGEAIFNSLNKNKNVFAESAGLIGSQNPTPDNVILVMKEKGYDILNRIPRRIDSISINNYDLLVIDADNVDPKFFTSSGYNGKIIWWKITDCPEEDILGIRERVDEIEKRVKKLILELKSSS